MPASSPINHLALVSETTHVDFASLAKVSAALQKQVMRDFTPDWGIQATVDAFASLDDVPTDYWPIIIRDDIQQPGAAGVHMDNNGAPFALVAFSNTWSLTASHECLEMLADPLGNTVRAGQSPKKGQGRVNFLVEVCDPSEDAQFSYTVNGIVVSDFYTPQFFDPVAVAGTRYSFSGAIKKPRDILKGGYLSWQHPQSGHWFQKVWFGAKPTFRDLGVLAQANGSIREQIYRATPQSYAARTPKPNGASLMRSASVAMSSAGNARSQALHAQINLLIGKKAASKKPK